jgi:hypothetical protein
VTRKPSSESSPRSPARRVESRRARPEAGEDAEQVRLRDLVAEPAVARVRGTREVSASSSRGRTAGLRIEPTLVSVTELEQLRRAIQFRSLYRAEAEQATHVGVRELGERVGTDVKRLVRRQSRDHRRLEQKVGAGDLENERRFIRESKKLDRETDKLEAHAEAALQRLQRRHLWDEITLIGSLPLFAAYGRRANPLAENNVALTISALVWLLGDEITDFFSGTPRPRDEIVRDRDIWSYIAPFGSLLTGWWLFNEQQHEQFVTGISDQFVEQPTLAPAEQRVFVVSFDLGPFIAPGHIEDFRTFAGVPVVASAMGEWLAALSALGADNVALSTLVELGVLTIVVTATSSTKSLPQEPLPRPTVAWMVDVRDPQR